MVIRTTTRTFAIALVAAMLAACASGAAVVRGVPVESAAPTTTFADDDADAFWDGIGDADQANLGFVETLP